MKTLFVAIGACAIALTAPASAQIVAQPTTIVDFGSYIGDSVSSLDWYKFSNSESTVYRSYNEVMAPNSVFMTEGWRVASLQEVQGLWSQFGWVADTPYSGVTANAGLTDALIGALGPSFSSVVADGYNSRGIVARYAGDIYGGHDTTWVYRETHVNPSVTQFLDFVSSSWGVVGDDVSNNYGTWLVRDHTVQIASPVPEPETYAMMVVGLLVVGLASRGRGARKC